MKSNGCLQRLYAHTQPKWLMLENVKNLVGKKFKTQFSEWLEWLDSMGYNTYWQVLNAKDYGVPQNRERVFAISIRKDIDTNGYTFPKSFDNGKRLKDVLEHDVDEKYYLSSKMVQGFVKHNENHAEKGTGFIWKPRNIYGNASTLRANGALAPTDNTIIAGSLNHYGNDQMNRVYDECGCSPTITVVSGGGREQKVLTRSAAPACCASRGRNPDNPSDRTAGAPTEQRLEFRTDGATNTLTTVQKDNYIAEPTVKSQANHNGVIDAFRIRKLTPLECWRLMGFTDEAFRKAEAVCSNSQLYKQAGNSIVVDVLYYIFKELFRDEMMTGGNK